MIKTINNIRMIMAMAVLSAVLFSCVREEMTCDKELIVVQRIGEGGYVYTRGTVISSNTDLKEETFGLYGSLPMLLFPNHTSMQVLRLTPT